MKPGRLTNFIMAAPLALMASAASAQERSAGDVATTLKNQLNDFGTLIMGAAFIAGIFFVGTGLMRLKAANDTQGQQVKYSEGVWRLAVGACLVALPAVVGIGMGTFGVDQTSTLTLTTGGLGGGSN